MQLTRLEAGRAPLGAAACRPGKPPGGDVGFDRAAGGVNPANKAEMPQAW